MKLYFVLFLAMLAVWAFANDDVPKKTSEDEAAGLFLGYLKRQSTDLTKTITGFEKMQQRQMLNSAKEKFWFPEQFQKDTSNPCCDCPLDSSCECCLIDMTKKCCD